MENKTYLKTFLIGACVLLFYFVASTIPPIVYELFNIDSPTIRAIFILIFQLLMIIAIIYVYRVEIKEQFIKFKKYMKFYMKNYIKFLFLSFGLVLITNLIIMGIRGSGVAQNQETIIGLAESLPIFTVILAVLYAPILEELVFRLAIRKICGKHNVLFIILSGTIFGALHVIGLAEAWQDYLFIISYSIPGCIFAYTLYKSENIFVPIALHTVNNLIAMIAIILLVFIQ